MIVIGLTGGIASGKSLISAELAGLGAVILDGDLIAREIVAPGSQALREISEAFGPEYLDESGALRRGALGELVFREPEKLRLLNGITHPLIRRELAACVEAARAAGEKAVILDVPLLFESGMADLADRVWVVALSEEKQKKRLMARDGVDEAAAVSRIGSQMPLEEKLKKADAVIDNNGPAEDTLKQARRLWRKTIAEATENHDE